ncbi:tubby-related protein 2 isoform X3 [Microcebus murinus]|uniref:tubby-related protein 2 isoform X3 n=1 Tax=Microcebus murinus TaxID=30608 RepID=UPI003F6DA4E3
MSQENDTWKKEILAEELAALRLQKLEQQWRLFEKKQRRKRQEPLMVQANPDASLRLRRLWRPEKHLRNDSGFENPFLQESVPEAHLSCGACSVPRAMTCGGDGSGERGPLASPTEAGASVEEKSESQDVGDEYKVPNVGPNPGMDGDLGPNSAMNGDLGPNSAMNGDLGPNPAMDGDLGPNPAMDTDLRKNPGMDGDLGSNPGMDGDLGPNPGMDGDLGPGNLTSHQVEGGTATEDAEDLEEKKEESGSAETSSPAPADQELAKALEGRVGVGTMDVWSMSCPAPCTLGRHLGESMEAYVLRPVLPGLTLQCLISRNKHGVDKGMYPSYYLFLEAADGRKPFLLAGRKRKRSKTSNYLISMDPIDLSRNGDYFVGKLRSNVLGTKFTIFDNGVNPNKQNCFLQSPHIRQELGAVCYETNILGSRGPRKMTVIIPAVDSQNQRIICQPQNAQGSILSRFHQGAMQELILLKSKTPLWSEESGAYVLNFEGRVTRASVKNFQIVQPHNAEYLVLQFGRVAQNAFTMDFRYPLCPLQAFAICLSSLDGKLACE